MPTRQLRAHSRRPAVKGPVVLAVLDGVGLGRRDEFDMVERARTPTLDSLVRLPSFAPLTAHGTAVGLPSDEDMGNSEVCHNALGCGRVVDQGATLVEREISSGAVFDTDTWHQIRDRCSGDGGTLHLVGLLSDGNVHSHERHLHELLRQAKRSEIERARVHVLLDGRDVPSDSALIYVDRLEDLLAQLNATARTDYRIASGGGRMTTTMDRYEADWSMVERGWRTHVEGDGPRFPSARAAIERFRSETPNLSDQFLPQFVIADEAGPVGTMEDGDAVVLFNFRGDRAIEICRAFESPKGEFPHFDRRRRPDVLFAGMTLYDGDTATPRRYLVAPPAIDETVSEWLVASGVTQFAISETQKFGHITYFWNGNRSSKFDERLETYVEIESDRVPFEERPWMKAAEITDRTIAALDESRFLRLNYANCDMVGHTGDLEATAISVEAVDLSLGRLSRAVEAREGSLVIVGDHGNADDMALRDGDGRPLTDTDGTVRIRTSHSLNPVPFAIHAPGSSIRLNPRIEHRSIGHVAATILDLMGFDPPNEYLPSLIA